MSDLFEKLNVLIKASLGDMLGEAGSPRRRALTPERLGKDIDREIAALRGRIDDALAYEDELKRKAATLADEVARWDQQADDAVVAGNDAAARHAVEQMQRAQQRLTIAQNDLRAHQLVTQDLIARVNLLDAVVAEARRRQQAETPPAPAQEAQPSGKLLSDVLRDAREKIAGLADVASAQQDIAMADTPPADDSAVEDDLDRRRQRLSK